MKPIAVRSSADWTVAELKSDPSWVISLDERAQRDLIGAVRQAHDPNKELLDYTRHDFDFGAGAAPLCAAFDQAKHGRATLDWRNHDPVGDHDFFGGSQDTEASPCDPATRASVTSSIEICGGRVVR